MAGLFALLAVGMMFIAIAGLNGVTSVERGAAGLYRENFAALQAFSDARAKIGALQGLQAAGARATGLPLRAAVGGVDRSLAALDRVRFDAPLEHRQVSAIRGAWSRYLREYRAGRPSVDRAGGLAPVVAALQVLANRARTEARERYADATGSLRATRRWVDVVLVLTGLFVAGALALVAREARRRRASERQRALLAGYQAAQQDFSETLQMSRTEREAHALVKSHLERCIQHSAVVVFNRNHSDNRLELATELAPDSALAERVATAGPEDCLAVRLGRTHERDGRDPLLRCELCGQEPGLSTCVPSLVSGQVIGSVLLEHAEPLDSLAARQLRESVSQAAPALANLRNLAIAERRAATDLLTGLPNRRAIEDTLTRMVAHAGRTLSPLSVVLVDLDHFKQINDCHGHAQGDEVLAFVGSTLSTTIRASDFAGRNGGEEFILLLPDTDSAGASLLAEKVRAAIEAISVPHVERPITASLGVATLPEHAVDAAMLTRQADRALYRAKNQGRNQVQIAQSPERHPEEQIPTTPG